MSKFNSKIFGENIRKFRKEKGLTQENLANKLNKNKATISRYESGELLPNAEEINIICNELEIYESDLFNRESAFSNDKHVSNPFETNKLYVYFNSFNPNTKKFSKDKWIINIREKPDRIEVDFVNYHTNLIHSTGYMLADDMVAFLSFGNYKPNQKRLDMSEIIIRVCYGTDELMMGAYFGTNAQYEPSIRKCFFSKNDMNFTDEMLEELKPTEEELKKLKENYALYFEIFKK